MGVAHARVLKKSALISSRKQTALSFIKQSLHQPPSKSLGQQSDLVAQCLLWALLHRACEVAALFPVDQTGRQDQQLARHQGLNTRRL
jgi:hypothetical protein